MVLGLEFRRAPTFPKIFCNIISNLWRGGGERWDNWRLVLWRWHRMFVENVNDSSKSPRDFDVVDFLSKLKRKEVQLNTSWFDKSFTHYNHLEVECLVSLRLMLCCFWSRSRLEAERGCSSDPDTKTRASPTEPARCCCTLKTVFKKNNLPSTKPEYSWTII